jgi:hypothetical protein
LCSVMIRCGNSDCLEKRSRALLENNSARDIRPRARQDAPALASLAPPGHCSSGVLLERPVHALKIQSLPLQVGFIS